MADNVVPYVIPLSAAKPKQLSLCPTDPGSRYKTRQLQVQIVGKSKMMKTMLVNILDVAKDMQVPPSYVGTFMGYEIGAQAKWDPKKPERQQAFLSGEHGTKELSKIALQFIQEVILCPNCNLPEIVTEVDQTNNKVLGRCRACGGFNELRITNEKFKRYILNHPPTTKGGSFSGAKNIKEKEAAVKKQVAKQNEREKAEKEKEEKPTFKKEKTEDTEDSVIWYSDTSDDAARARREKMMPDAFTKTAKKLPEVSEVKANLSSPEKVYELKTLNGLSNSDFIPVLFEAITSKDVPQLTAIVQNKDLVKKFVEDEEGQIALLRCIEKFCGEVQPTLLPKASHIIKEIYDKELLDEDSILSWANDSTNAIVKVRESVAPLIKWFKETENEGEDDEDEEGEEEEEDEE